MRKKDAFGGKTIVSQESSEEKSYTIGLGLCAHGADANSSVVDVKGGKIVQTRVRQLSDVTIKAPYEIRICQIIHE